MEVIPSALLGVGSHTLHVNAGVLDAHGQAVSASHLSFSVVAGNRQSPVVISDVTVVPEATKNGKITLAWTGSRNLRYRVERSDRGAGSYVSLNSDDVILANRFADHTVMDGVFYDYRVTAVDQAGQESPPSNVVAAISQDTIAPELAVLSSPTNDPFEVWRTNAASVTVAGTASMDARTIEVSGTSLAGPTFSTSVALSDGENIIPVRMIDEAGNVSVFEVRVIRDTSVEAPSGLTAFPVGSDILVSWSETSDSEVADFHVERNDAGVGGAFVSVATTKDDSYTATGAAVLSPPPAFRVRAEDSSGNFSAYSEVIKPTDCDHSGDPGPALSTTTAPSLPELDAQGTSFNVSLGTNETKWSAPPVLFRGDVPPFLYTWPQGILIESTGGFGDHIDVRVRLLDGAKFDAASIVGGRELEFLWATGTSAENKSGVTATGDWVTFTGPLSGIFNNRLRTPRITGSGRFFGTYDGDTTGPLEFDVTTSSSGRLDAGLIDLEHSFPTQSFTAGSPKELTLSVSARANITYEYFPSARPDPANSHLLLVDPSDTPATKSLGAPNIRAFILENPLNLLDLATLREVASGSVSVEITINGTQSRLTLALLEYRFEPLKAGHQVVAEIDGTTVNILDGQLRHELPIFSALGPGMPVDLTLSYNSYEAVRHMSVQRLTKAKALSPSPFGAGWGYFYGMRLLRRWQSEDVSTGDTNTHFIEFLGPDGRRSRFTEFSSGGYGLSIGEEFRWLGGNAPYSVVLKDNGAAGFTLSGLSGDVFHFEPLDPSNGKLGRLTKIDLLKLARDVNISYSSASQRITDTSGREIVLAQGASGHVQAVTDPRGHAWAFSYQNGFLTRVRCVATGDEWRYAYDGDGLVAQKEGPRGFDAYFTYHKTGTTPMFAWGNLASSYRLASGSKMLERTFEYTPGTQSPQSDKIVATYQAEDAGGTTQAARVTYERLSNDRTNITDPGNGVTQLFFVGHELGHVVDPENMLTTWSRTGIFLHKVDLPNGATAKVDYETDASGVPIFPRPKATTDFLGGVTNLRYLPNPPPGTQHLDLK